MLWNFKGRKEVSEVGSSGEAMQYRGAACVKARRCERTCSENCRWFVWLEGRRESEQMGRSQAFSLGQVCFTEFFAHFIIPGQSDGPFSSVFQNCHLYCLIFSFFTVTHAHYRKLKNKKEYKE